ncbi:MAG TPA: Crp/Fnr family transcriptional regulator [Clostridiales bacterium]|nr:Crp/Fnr family transcriptional regulator [Clostridiales bacterium]
MEINECALTFRKYLPFWDKLEDSDKSLLCDNSSLLKYPKGTNVHGGSGECTGAVLVKSGCLRTYIMSETGKEVTLYRLYPGDLCMLSASCVLKAITFDVFVDAEDDSECYVIGGRVLAEITDRNIYAENFALQVAVERFSDVMWVMQQILFMSFDRRLAIFLWDEISKTGQNTVHLTHEQIAKYMGSAREVVSRMLKYFAAEGVTENTRGGVTVLDKEKLRALAMG